MLSATTKLIGKYTRFYYLKLVGNPKPLERLSNIYEDDYDDLGNALAQDIKNNLVGTLVFIILVLFIVLLDYYII